MLGLLAVLTSIAKNDSSACFVYLVLIQSSLTNSSTTKPFFAPGLFISVFGYFSDKIVYFLFRVMYFMVTGIFNLSLAIFILYFLAFSKYLFFTVETAKTAYFY